jgi:hypothetical protein
MRKGLKNRRAPRVLADLARVEFRQLDRQRTDRKARLDRIRDAGNRSRRLERERKARLQAETAAILAEPQPQLRKKRG